MNKLECSRSMIIADSTRAGKRMPDALSKTVPIWCAVVNRAIVRRHPGPDKSSWDTALYTPPGVVSGQEHHQIELRLDAWAEALYKSSFDLPALPAPLRPFWITPATTTFPTFTTSSGSPFLPVICLSASRQSEDARRTAGFSYIQGSGDDHELWSMGLTPAHYWRHASVLLSAGRSDLPDLVQHVISSDSQQEDCQNFATEESEKTTRIAKVHGRLRIGTFNDAKKDGWDENLAYVLLKSTSDASAPDTDSETRSLALSLCPRIKTHLSQSLLPSALPFIARQLASGRSVCIVSGGENSGHEAKVADEGVAITLAALVLFFDNEGTFTGKGADLEADCISDGDDTSKILPHIDKSSIRTRLEWVIACRPAVNPARATLKRLNEFLMSREHTQR
ncbi:hypothetical protein H0H93_007646 [Arthromyces matolae]|nr:hypothetical protein H0H93_007646 [Arthromyces matolae]